MQQSTGPMIHIVGLYKCGTTWLLRALAAHPEVIAFREFDPVAAVSSRKTGAPALAATARRYLRRRPRDSSWMQQCETRVPRSREEAFREMFLGRGWMPVMGEAAQARAAALYSRNLDILLDPLLEATGLELRADSAPALNPSGIHQPLGVRAFRRGQLMALMQSVQTVGRSEDIPNLFYRHLREDVAPGAAVVCKAADQIMHLDALRRATPGARLIAVVRDGRDAAVSAQHFEALMRKQQAPWRVPRGSTIKRLLSWGVRAAKLAEHARRGEVLVIRYEDLHSDFASTISRLLAELDLDHGSAVVQGIETKSSFRAASGGRAQGEGAQHIVRRGVVGEWQEAFGAAESALAWTLVGNELSRFGYGKKGEVSACSLVL